MWEMALWLWPVLRRVCKCRNSWWGHRHFLWGKTCQSNTVGTAVISSEQQIPRLWFSITCNFSEIFTFLTETSFLALPEGKYFASSIWAENSHFFVSWRKLGRKTYSVIKRDVLNEKFLNFESWHFLWKLPLLKGMGSRLVLIWPIFIVKINFWGCRTDFIFCFPFSHECAQTNSKYMWVSQVLSLPLNYPSHGVTAEIGVPLSLKKLVCFENSGVAKKRLLFSMKKNGQLFTSSLVWSVRSFHIWHTEVHVIPERGWYPNTCTWVNG